ncbi:F-box protein CPR1-like [Silene latifolia]|uniref:F-box protein CPR1-like n=1 Tax=Silene latifolia TaxID=37657 RepID=UPI003D77869A
MSKRARGIVAHRIPLDLVVDILVCLPAKSVLQFKCVCKEWYNLINSPLLHKLHLNKSLEPNSQHNNCILYWTTSILCVVDNLYDHPIKVTELNWPITIEDDDCIRQVDSCNGLICFDVSTLPYYKIRSFLLCNLTTRTFKSIFPPSEKIWSQRGADSVLYSFGYDSEHDDYKIVVTRSLWTEDNRDSRIFIYSLKTNLWTSSYSPLTRISTEGRLSNICQAIFGHNMLHYLVETIKGFIEDYRIARFDVADEKWTDDLSLPNQVKSIVRLGNLDGRLYVHALNNYYSSTIIWMMEEDGSWKKMFQLPKELHSQHLIACSKDGRRQHLLLQDYDGPGDVLKWYDQQNNKRIPLNLKPPPKDRYAVMLCIASLIRIPRCSLTKLQEMNK